MCMDFHLHRGCPDLPWNYCIPVLVGSDLISGGLGFQGTMVLTRMLLADGSLSAQLLMLKPPNLCLDSHQGSSRRFIQRVSMRNHWVDLELSAVVVLSP